MKTREKERKKERKKGESIKKRGQICKRRREKSIKGMRHPVNRLFVGRQIVYQTSDEDWGRPKGSKTNPETLLANAIKHGCPPKCSLDALDVEVLEVLLGDDLLADWNVFPDEADGCGECGLIKKDLH